MTALDPDELSTPELISRPSEPTATLDVKHRAASRLAEVRRVHGAQIAAVVGGLVVGATAYVWWNRRR